MFWGNGPLRRDGKRDKADAHSNRKRWGPRDAAPEFIQFLHMPQDLPNCDTLLAGDLNIAACF